MNTTDEYQMMVETYDRIGRDSGVFENSEVAHVLIHGNKVLGTNLVPGLEASTKELEDGVSVAITVEKNAVIEKTVHMCFGMLPEEGLQRILMDVDIEAGASVDILAHCVFPNAVDVRHVMEAEINIGEGASYRYFERHVHGDKGGVTVVPRADVRLGPDALFKTEFELIEGRVGEIEIDYETWCERGSSLEMVARIAGLADDVIRIKEIAHLEGEGAAGALLSRIAVSDGAMADIYNELTASAPHAKGHVDCKEIVQDEAIARATPVVDVRHPLARVTHEAAIGSVDSKQLQTLMSRGMSEDEATSLIIQGMLRRQEPSVNGQVIVSG